jgi:cbb3-type cytochrome oxidase subunit 3
MKKFVFLFAIIYIFTYDILAQCAMCKATVETHARSGENKASGLNIAILYLLLIPYVCAMVFWYLWKTHKKKIAEEQELAEKEQD